MRKLFIPITLFLISCKSTQVYETKPASKNMTIDEYAYFENDTVKIKYSFWAYNYKSGGVITYSFTNKLNIPLYIDWKKCSFVKNGAKNDYWQDITVSSSYTKTTWIYYGDFDYSNYKEWQVQNTKTKKPERITFLAPKSTITRVWNSITQSTTSISGKPCVLPINGSKRSQKAKCQDFTEENSRLKFRNFMTISTTENFEKESYIDNEFYVSKIYQIKNSHFVSSYFMKPTRFFVKPYIKGFLER